MVITDMLKCFLIICRQDLDMTVTFLEPLRSKEVK